MSTRRTFVTFAVAFLVSATVGVAQANLITNGNFSANAALYQTFPGVNGGSNPTAPTGWTPGTNPSNQGVNGPDTSSGNTFGPSSTTGVRDFMFLQGGTTSAAQQNLAFQANTNYTLTFSVAGRNGDPQAQSSSIPDDFSFQVNHGATNVAGFTTHALTSGYNNYVVSFTTLPSASTGSLTLSNASGAGDRTVDFSNITLNSTTNPVVLNSGFESPSVSLAFPAYQAGSIPNWGSNGGVVANGSAYGNSAAPEGIQAGLLQNNGNLSQLVNGFTVGGQYEISFLAEGRPGLGPNPIEVMVGSTIVTFSGAPLLTPGSSTQYNLYTSDGFAATAASETLQLLGKAPANTDLSSFIDNVQFQTVPEPSSVVFLGLGVVGLVLAARRRRKA